MAAIDSDTKPKQKHPFSDQRNQDNPTKFHYNFLYKALVVSLFLIILPLFPSQAPDFVNQTLLTRSWELLHLLLVGIAISYGLFSRKNDNDDDSKNEYKFDNAQNYVSRYLQVSSVFDDDSENPSVSDENKVQTWSSQYFRNEPVVVVAQESKKIVSKSVEKPLLLPVRSLKETSSVSDSLSRSNSRRFSSHNGEFGALDREELTEEEKVKKESVVLPSPIPWRSRSGRLETKEEESLESRAVFPSMEEPELYRVESRVLRSQSSRFSRSDSANSPKLSPSPSAKKPSPSPSSLSLESQAKIAEDMVKKKSFCNKANPPPTPPPPPPPPTPPPPPPPPSFYQSSSSTKPISSVKEAKKKAGFDQTCFEKEEEEEEDLEEKVVVESDQEETESEDDEIGPSFSQNFKGEIAKRNDESGSSSVGDGGPDVDKKADEFIAKFREQIRLQRIESIKRSSAQMSRKLAR
ncbi:hypothetical protein L484_024060 [Morus notabilis]|uniref:DUF4408 domain-containing protein n=1 Tax=Morus notabilis TaxID=981085 RepID=W9S0F9_9ROSA|nr:leiomodin-2 [Morus notabilis]EXC02095.1 hypothetical protein L484_024060 [Morus notabilis]